MRCSWARWRLPCTHETEGMHATLNRLCSSWLEIMKKKSLSIFLTHLFEVLLVPISFPCMKEGISTLGNLKRIIFEAAPTRRHSGIMQCTHAPCATVHHAQLQMLSRVNMVPQHASQQPSSSTPPQHLMDIVCPWQTSNSLTLLHKSIDQSSRKAVGSLWSLTLLFTLISPLIPRKLTYIEGDKWHLEALPSG